ncbi:hypothetical protein PspLS_05195 [Pyricularia sp. CBS 133598]|nr:hypothetical protein PspLS_05195 [Pyricularia sp. CBS 133598]
MADPLSVAASVVGLITAAAQVSQVLTEVISKARSAPDECHKARNNVNDISGILGQLQLFLNGVSRAPRSRTSLIMVDHVVVTLAACVTTFSELDALAASLQSDVEMSMLDRLRWVSKEKQINNVLVRLESHKSSLTLMLTILTCQKQDDAEDTVDMLCDLVKTTLEQNVIISQRLAALESYDLPRHGTNRDPIVAETSNTQEPDHVTAAGKDVVAGGIARASTWRRDARGFAFEELLINSRAYRNAARDNSDAFSIMSSAGRTASWSMLSGLSMSEVSHIGILALPIYATDITNKDAYNFNLPTGKEVTSLLDEKSSSEGGSRNKGARRKWLRNLFSSSSAPQEQRPEQTQERQVFGVALRESITYANVCISLIDCDGYTFVYGYIPTVVAKVGVFVKQSGLAEKDIFAVNGNPARVFHLQEIFNKPPGYGKDHIWDGYAVRDAAGLLLRYLKALPEPVIPYARYEELVGIMQPTVAAAMSAEDQTHEEEGQSRSDCTLPLVIDFVVRLPPLNRHILLYLLDALAAFAYSKHDNNMTAHRLVALFQPCILAGPPATMDADAYHVAAQIAVYLIDNQDSFLVSIETGQAHNTNEAEF